MYENCGACVKLNLLSPKRKQKQHPLITLCYTRTSGHCNKPETKNCMTGTMWLSINALCSVKGIIQKATHCVPGMILWKSRNDKGRKQTTLLAVLAGRVGPQSNRGGFQDNKIVLCPIFGRYYTTVYICYNQWSGFWERIYFLMFIFHLGIYMSHKKKTPLIETVRNESWEGGFLFFCFLSLVLWLHVFPKISMYLSTLCHSAILKDDSFISFAFEKRSWIPSIY